jgi:hypothetical protein
LSGAVYGVDTRAIGIGGGIVAAPLRKLGIDCGCVVASLRLRPSAAFKHGVSEADIRNAFVNALYDDVLDVQMISILCLVLTAMAISLKFCIISLINIL